MNRPYQDLRDYQYRRESEPDGPEYSGIGILIIYF